jgi:phage repressor protein C with HTH and peptisase S24 domain
MGLEYAGILPRMSTGKLPLTTHGAARVKFRTMEKQLKERIERRLKELNLSARAASLQAGGSPDLIRGLLRDKQSSFSGKNLLKIAEVLGVSVNWLLTGDREHIPSEEIARNMTEKLSRENNGHSSLESYRGRVQGAVPEIDAKAGAGDGNVGEEEVVSLRRGEAYIGHKVTAEWVFPRDFVHHELRTRPSQIIVLEVVGDSMSPSLEGGDRVIIDTSYTRPTPDGIYVIDEGYGPMVKRLQLVRLSNPPEVRIISDNKNHYEYTLKLEDVRIIGRVSGRVTRM